MTAVAIATAVAKGIATGIQCVSECSYGNQATANAAAANSDMATPRKLRVKVKRF